MTFANGRGSGGGPPGGFISLRTKLVAFISLIIVVICSALSAYFIAQRAAAMESWKVSGNSLTV